MRWIVPWLRLIALIEPHCTKGKTGRPPFPIATMLRIHLFSIEFPFRVIKRQFGYAMTHYRGLMKNTAQIATLFALSNLWTARRALRK
jgi:IS5 family transposase